MITLITSYDDFFFSNYGPVRVYANFSFYLGVVVLVALFTESVSLCLGERLFSKPHASVFTLRGKVHKAFQWRLTFEYAIKSTPHTLPGPTFIKTAKSIKTSEATPSQLSLSPRLAPYRHRILDPDCSVELAAALDCCPQVVF